MAHPTKILGGLWPTRPTLQRPHVLFYEAESRCDSRHPLVRYDTIIYDRTYAVHINSVGVSSGMLIRLDKSSCERLGDEVEPDELTDAGQSLAVVLSALVDAQHY